MILKAIARAWRNWWAGFIMEPTEIGVEGRELRPFEEGYVPVTAAPGRAMFSAPRWFVPAKGPHEPGPSRAEQLEPKLIDYEWDVLRDAAGRPTETGRDVIAGAAYNECATFLRKAGALDLMGKPTELGLELLRLRDGDPSRIDVV